MSQCDRCRFNDDRPPTDEMSCRIARGDGPEADAVCKWIGETDMEKGCPSFAALTRGRSGKPEAGVRDPQEPPMPGLSSDHPTVRLVAPQMARYLFDLEYEALKVAYREPVLNTWENLSPQWQQARVDACAHLLCDLSLPAARAFWREQLGVSVGLDTKGGIVFTRVTRMDKGKPAKVGDWVVSDFNGTDVTVLAESRITDQGEALLEAILTVLPPAP